MFCTYLLWQIYFQCWLIIFCHKLLQGSSYILILLLLHGFLSSLYLHFSTPYIVIYQRLYYMVHTSTRVVYKVHHKTQKSIAVVVSIFLYMLLAHTWFFNASVLASTLALLGTGRPPITTWLYLLLKSFFSVNDLKAK